MLRTAVPVPLWMAWNTFLALVPLGLSTVLFRDPRRSRRTLGWWVLCSAFVLLLPNAPYVLTDVVHLVDDAQDGALLRTWVLYGAFFAVGVAAYTIAVARFVRYLRRCGAHVGVVAAVEGTLHVACAAGVLVGRFGRWNSWDLAFRPWAVVHDSTWLAAPRSVAVVLMLAMTFAMVTATLRLAARGAAVLARDALLG